MRLTDSFSTSSLNSSLVVNKNETTVTIDEKKHTYHDENQETTPQDTSSRLMKVNMRLMMKMIILKD